MKLLQLSILSTGLLLSQSILADDSSNALRQLQRRTDKLEKSLNSLVKSKSTTKPIKTKKKPLKNSASAQQPAFEEMQLSVHTFKGEANNLTYSPSALMAGDSVLTYIVGMPVVTTPYLGRRPAFDGSDFITNISSINQDVRLMIQRNALSRSIQKLGYPVPKSPILALSGAIEPFAFHTQSYSGQRDWDLDLGTSKLDVAAALNSWVEGYFSFAYDSSPPAISGYRVSNSSVALGKGFINVGNLDHSPIYFTAGQLYVPFGRYSSSMISAPMPLRMARTLARTVILGYRHQEATGLFAAAFGFKGDTTNNSRAVYGLNLGYDFRSNDRIGEIGVSLISSINDAGGMQRAPGAAGQFSGFGKTSQTEAVDKVPAIDLHFNLSVNAYNFSVEWVGVTQAFRNSDLSFNQQGAKPQSLNAELGHTFKAYKKPASIAIGYGWSDQALALKLPKQRVVGVFNISIWRDTVQSIEVRHDIDYAMTNQGAGIGSTSNTNGTGKSSNSVLAQFGVYF